jgi:hypothetical protein
VKGRVNSAKVLTIRFIPVDELALNFAQIAVKLDTTQVVCCLWFLGGKPPQTLF